MGVVISDNTVISAGATTGTVSFTPTDDSTYEGNEIGILQYLLLVLQEEQVLQKVGHLKQLQ